MKRWKVGCLEGYARGRRPKPEKPHDLCSRIGDGGGGKSLDDTFRKDEVRGVGVKEIYTALGHCS